MAFIGAIVGAISSVVVGITTFIGGLGWIGQMVIGIGLNLVGNAIARKKQKKVVQRLKRSKVEHA